MFDESTQKKAALRERLNEGQALLSPLGRPLLRPGPAPLTVHQTGFAQHTQVVADGGLVLVEVCHDGTDAHRLPLVYQHIQHAQTGSISQRLQLLGQLFRMRWGQYGWCWESTAGIG